MTYSLGCSVVPQVLVRRERWPGGDWLQALPLVTLGQDVSPDQPVMRLVKAEQIEKVASSAASTKSRREEVEGSDALMLLPAGMSGRVVEITPRGGVVIESRSALVLGALGAGKQVAGIITLWQPEQIEGKPRVIPPGAILVVPGSLNLELLTQALRSGVCGVVASSIVLADLEGFLRTDVIQLVSDPDIEHTQTHLPPLTILLTEGIGSFAMPQPTLDLLSQYEGAIGLLTGTTSLCLGLFPDLVLALDKPRETTDEQLAKSEAALAPGVVVRVCGGEYEGVVGVIDYLFVYQQIFPSGIRARAVRL
ncbi:MAG TPA: hypothetical protein VHZ51_10985, partial [Ktedonobacteraceae bacterium]|nr:hypothetical protein [Ktedonobacteraceae bacterium]